MSERSRKATGRIGRVASVLLAAGIGLVATGATAFADPPWGHDHWDHHGWHHDWRHHDDDGGWRRGYVYGYAPPPAYYPPPPVYYAPPPPVYVGPPSVSFGVNIPLGH